ncbi:MAG: helix-turn-helix transcriptional regulator [Actinomycetota bacterium]
MSDAQGPPPGPQLREVALRHRLLSDPTRLSIAFALRSAPATVSEVAAAVGVHVNTARAHLERLHRGGLVTVERSPPRGRGRPGVFYRLSPEAPVSDVVGREYRFLAEVLLGIVRGNAGKSAAAQANRSGRAWGRHLAAADAPRPGGAPDPTGAARHLSMMHDRLQFAPELQSPDHHGWVLLLHNCPFRELVEKNHDVICSFHLGFARGLLEAVDAPLEAASLDPFVEPDLCRLSLSVPPERARRSRGRAPQASR